MPHTMIENCAVCGFPHECIATGPKDWEEGIEGSCTGAVCDNLPTSGCLKHFCKECIGIHKCDDSYGKWARDEN